MLSVHGIVDMGHSWAAWFIDPSGNVLAVVEPKAEPSPDRRRRPHELARQRKSARRVPPAVIRGGQLPTRRGPPCARLRCTWKPLFPAGIGELADDIRRRP